MTTRSSRDDAASNEVLRKQFEEWYKFNNNPSIKKIAKEADINYEGMIGWRNRKREFGYKSITKLRKYFFKLAQRQEENNKLIKELHEYR